MADPRALIIDFLYLPPGTCYGPEHADDMAAAIQDLLHYTDRLPEPLRTGIEHQLATSLSLITPAEPATVDGVG